MTLTELQDTLRDFASERDWEQFHTPKNLAMALSGEVGELTELFQWLTPQESEAIMSDPRRAEHVREELADVFGYLLRLADVFGIDLEQALIDKVRSNAAKYPVEKARGNAAKYTEFPS